MKFISVMLSIAEFHYYTKLRLCILKSTNDATTLTIPVKGNQFNFLILCIVHYLFFQFQLEKHKVDSIVNFLLSLLFNFVDNVLFG